MKSVTDAPEIPFFIPPMPKGDQHHVISRGQSPYFYGPEELRDKGPGKTPWVDTFEKILVGPYLELDGAVPYAFRTPEGTVRSLDAGCIKMMLNRSPPGLELLTDRDGYIDAVIPAAQVLALYGPIKEHLSEHSRGERARLMDDQTRDVPTFILEAGPAKARAKPGPRRTVLVLAGSTAIRSNTRSTTDRDREERDRLVRQGVLVPDTRNAGLLKFDRDHEFESATAAAGVVNDGNKSGPSSWKNPATKKTLKDYWGK